jgi:hypothetical protein
MSIEDFSSMLQKDISQKDVWKERR